MLQLRWMVSIMFASASLCACGVPSAPVWLANNAVHEQHSPAVRTFIYVVQIVSGSPIRIVDVLGYPSGSYIGTLSGMEQSPQSLCADGAGDVFVMAPITIQSAYIYEFGPGATNPTRVLSDPGMATGCSVDPTTGNVAVANVDANFRGHAQGDIAIFPASSGYPTLYVTKGSSEFLNCAYDGKGNLLVDGLNHLGEQMLAFLPRGSKKLAERSFNKFLSFPGPIQWDGRYFAIGYGATKGELYQVQVSGTTATVVRTIKLRAGRAEASNDEFAIHRNSIVSLAGPKDHSAAWIAFWKYPVGGQPTRLLKSVGNGLQMNDLTVSPTLTR
jgi:hypothetical protein